MRTPGFGAALTLRNRLSVGSVSCVLETVSIAQFQDRIQLSVDMSPRGGSPCPPRNPTLLRKARQGSSFAHLRGFSVLILVC
jgi:hypothetical protein